MPESEVTKLRRARSRVHRNIEQHERLPAFYRAKLANLDGRVHDLAPELVLPVAHRKPNPVFARGQLTRLARPWCMDLSLA
jgi:hypothetical protein